MTCVEISLWLLGKLYMICSLIKNNIGNGPVGRTKLWDSFCGVSMIQTSKGIVTNTNCEHLNGQCQ